MTTPIPEVYVLWHPDCFWGKELSHRIYDWLRPGHGLGPQVFFRSLPDPKNPEQVIPVALPGEIRGNQASTETTLNNGKVQILILLIDANMVADAAWRYWIQRLRASGTSQKSHIFLPVALDTTAYNLNDGLRQLNFLRPVDSGGNVGNGRSTSQSQENMIRSLLKQITETLARLLWDGSFDFNQSDLSDWFRNAATPKVKIFLSHAKADGTSPARRIRDYIYSQTQIAAFFDENDIPLGTGFANVLDQNIEGEETAAMIAVRTEVYARRPWCRRELSVFRRPRRNPRAPNVNNVEHWSLQPVLVVDALEERGRTESLPEFGNTPVIRWNEDPELPEEIVTTLLRDALLAAHHNASGAALQLTEPALVLNWRPDPISLLQLPSVRFDESENVSERKWDVFHPGREFSGQDLDIFYEYFPNLDFYNFDSVISS